MERLPAYLHGVRRWAADAVSLSRLVLLFPLVWCEIAASPWALAVLAVIVVSDLIDGPIARWLGTAGSRGAFVDAACDVAVVMSAAIAAGISDARYAGLAAVMALAFLSYAGLSLILRRFAYTRLGRYGAVSYGVAAMAGGKALLSAIGVSVPAAVEAVFLCASAFSFWSPQEKTSQESGPQEGPAQDGDALVPGEPSRAPCPHTATAKGDPREVHAQGSQETPG